MVIADMSNYLDPERRKQKTTYNKQQTPEVLKQFGYPFQSKNDDEHLIVQTIGGKVDLWPGTGKWIARFILPGRAGREGRGVFVMMKIFPPPDGVDSKPGEGQPPIQRQPHMSDFAVQVYRDAGFTVVE